MGRNELIDFIVETRADIEDINTAQRLKLIKELNIKSYEWLEKEADFCEELLYK